ncbi:MAG TPA: glycosyltransferase family 4 protein [Candidatus Dormibacteraeota bacterium]|jgi:hypothetical protein|nr:glycosyltransferase family 4 protein [Candidatus Dormibacteraeota bacterium]
MIHAYDLKGERTAMDKLPSPPVPGMPIEFQQAQPGDLVRPANATAWQRLVEVRHDYRSGAWEGFLEELDSSKSSSRTNCHLHDPGCLVWRPLEPSGMEMEASQFDNGEPSSYAAAPLKQDPAPHAFRSLRASKKFDGYIWYICPDVTQPTGGVQVIYRHVRYLNEAGLRAAVVHDQPSFRYPWAPEDACIVSRGEVDPDPTKDIVVWPEFYGSIIGSWGLGCRRVILNQGPSLTFTALDFFDPKPLPYLDDLTIAVVVVSEYGRRWLEYAFPWLRVKRITVAIDDHLFKPAQHKTAQICIMPRKGADEANQILNILRHRGSLEGVNIVLIDGQPAVEVARVMRDSLMFLTLSYHEGFGLPAAEAMACGCIVIGYDGGGGAEFMRPGLAYPVPTGDVIGVVNRVEHVLTDWQRRPGRVLAMGQRASRFVRERYSLAYERADVLQLWRDLLDPDQTRELEGRSYFWSRLRSWIVGRSSFKG